MGYGTARRKPVPAGMPRLFRRSRTGGASHDAAGRFPVDSLLFTGPRGARWRVGWVERSETHRACCGLMGFARAQPILRFLRAAPHGPPSRGCVVFSLLFTRRRGLEGEFLPAPALSLYRGSFHLRHLMVRSARSARLEPWAAGSGLARRPSFETRPSAAPQDEVRGRGEMGH